VAAGEYLGKAPVHDLDLAEGADHHVRRLEVAVNDIVGVGKRDCLADLLEDRHETPALGRLVGSGVKQLLQGLALD
jgi:hypothetical protein